MPPQAATRQPQHRSTSALGVASGAFGLCFFPLALCQLHFVLSHMCIAQKGKFSCEATTKHSGMTERHSVGAAEVAAVYDEVASVYDSMMQEEMEKETYHEYLGHFAQLVSQNRHQQQRQCLVVDVACGSGNMLEALAPKLEKEQESRSKGSKSGNSFLGIDCSAEMVKLAAGRVEALGGRAVTGDMRQLEGLVEPASAAGMISFFGLHFVDVDELEATLEQWARVLCPGAPLLLGYWEGDGKRFFEPGLQLTITNHNADHVTKLLHSAGFATILHEKHIQQPEGNTVHLIAIKQ